jgi:hypothetical protein
MQILAIFDCADIDSCFEPLRKKKYLVTLVSNWCDGKKLMQEKVFDLILCQASFDTEAENAFDYLKEIRQKSDIPFICCRVGNVLDDTRVDNVFQVTLPLLGGQGFIDNETFHSKRLLPAIEKCLSSAVGSPCSVNPLYGDKSKNTIESH